ncbi:HARBI1 [Mytilus coruscus]|uniref:HARBI1 n=1 Tax=Mytilus coruscus TaxID=42192 RepID=A0A6J8E9I4_MYTCO|nr:HARBI1 [Mytilus coruscus]
MRPDRTCTFIVACAILHNKVIMLNEPMIDNDDIPEEQPVIQPYKGQQDGQNCRTRGVFCTVGNQWVHYMCQKLTSDEINEVESDSGNYFKCAICRDQEIEVINHSSANDLTVNSETSIRIPPCNDNLLALTQELDSTRIDEAQEADKDILYRCTVCDINIQSDSRKDSSDICSNIVQRTCTENDDSNSGIIICIPCKASIDIRKEDTGVISGKGNISQNDDTVSITCLQK